MKTKVFLVLVSLLFSVTGHAKLAGKNVVLVQGFNAPDLVQMPNVSKQRSNANAYWDKYWGARADVKLYWSSADRISGKIKDSMRTQIKALENAGTCRNGCVFVTHSTGDLVVRDALSRLGQWGVNRNNFKVLTVLDFAGAGGGTGLADLAYNVAKGARNTLQLDVIGSFLGFRPTLSYLGVLNDIRVSTARNRAQGAYGVPRLRFVGSGDQFLRITKPFLKGYDDSVVAFHSACGSRYVSDYKSCSRSIKTNGQLKSTHAPSSFLPDHYPILMGDKADHSEVIGNKRSGDYATIVNDRTLGLRVDFNDYTERKWWSWWRKVRLVRNGSNKSMSANVYDTLNN
ncbi:MAG: hypothetical protein MK188_01165 [Gammaproteobacteria bacterium]|nr:hypothetical protein [Gammaproteobacteria bacterium]